MSFLWQISLHDLLNKVNNAVYNIQIVRMLELPIIYRRIYDQAFHSSVLEKEEALW